MYRRPGEVRTALGLTENNFLNGITPGISSLIDQINLGRANAIDSSLQTATSSADALDAIAKIDYNHGQKMNDVALQEQEIKNDLEKRYISQLMNNADYTDKEFEINQWTPYENKVAQGEALIGAGNINKKQGISDLAKLGSGAAMYALNNKVRFDTGNRTVS